MRILLVSSMYPGPADPDFGAFVAQVERELERQGHELARAVVDRRGGGKGKQLRLVRDAMRHVLRFRPDVIYAHFLVPAGAVAALASVVGRVPVVLTAHGADVRNVGAIPGVEAATRLAARRAAAIVAVSHYLRRQLEVKLPELAGRVEVIDCGVDLERFHGRDALPARQALGWEGSGTSYLCVGSLDERKNVVRLAEAFERLGAGRLAFVGDGPLRGRLEGRRDVRVVGRVPHQQVADWIAAADVVCQPSVVEPFGQALLEAMAGERSVVATRVGGPPEFVGPRAGVLVDPSAVEAIEDGLRRSALLPTPNPDARRAAAEHDVRRQAERISELLARAAAGSTAAGGG